MRFSDTTQFQIPKQIKYANSDSFPFNSDESSSDEDSSQTFMTPSTTSNQHSPQSSRTPPNHKPLTPPTNDNSLYTNKINTPPTNIPSDRSRHLSQKQTDSLPPLIDRTTKTTYQLQHQPKLDYRLFIPPSKF